MQRKNARRIAAFAVKSGLHRPENKATLEEALAGCRNLTTRAKLRSRIQRGG